MENKNIFEKKAGAKQEFTIEEATRLIPKLVPHVTKDALIGRLKIDDPVIRAWALEQLLKNSSDLTVDVASCMKIAQHSEHIRLLLVPVFIKAFRFDLVDQLIEIDNLESEKTRMLSQNLLKAMRDNDFEAQVGLLEQLYLSTGDLNHVAVAAEVARTRLGWKAAWKPLLRQLFVNAKPASETILGIMRMLEREDAKKEFAEFGQQIKTIPGAGGAFLFYLAQQYFWAKDYKKCIDTVLQSKLLDSPGGKASFIYNLLARSAEKMGDYRGAAAYYDEQNQCAKDGQFEPSEFMARIERRSHLNIGPLPPDKNENYLVMTGFPRSGTTLLENVLASHPRIVTCEETSSLLNSVAPAYMRPLKDDPDCKNLNLRGWLHRDLYYKNLSRFAAGGQEKVVIDKTPIMSAQIKYLEKIFPRKKYIFSIRHPYDVVLSCYKQDFKQNAAMVAFNSIRDACTLYDFTMRNWFEVFPGETDRVCYIKYDDLVLDFDSTVRRALDFIGVEWTDEVKQFADNASKRAVRTPSYSKVRQGLSIGVQTSWQNFDFLFDQECRKLLDPWVERFGYAK